MRRRLLPRFLFERLTTTLGILLGSAQVLIGHWTVVVLAGREGPGLAPGLVLGLLLVLANLLALPILRRALAREGLARAVARAYLAVGLGTIVLGGAIAAAWAGFLPLAGLLGAAGLSPESALGAFRVATLPVLAALLFMLVWGFSAGQRRVDRTHVRVELPGLDRSLHGLRIVQVSDLHIGNGLEGERLERLVTEVNALEPDLVALTGDLFDYDPRHVEPGARRLGALRARLGVYAVLGNHDRYTGNERIAEALAQHAPQLTLLRGHVVRLPVEPPLYVAGIDDPLRDWSDEELELEDLAALAAARPDDGPVLLLVHRPEAFPQAARLGFPLMLAGHTHGGQIALPTPGGHWNPARLLTRYYRGLYRENGCTLYVNRGFGVAGPPIRFNCPREIATIELVGAS